MSAPVIWILASASALLLIAGGFTVAVARFRSKVIRQRRQAARLGAQLESRPADPFGELAVMTDQLRKIQLRLGEAEGAAGLPMQRPAAAPAPPSSVAALELEQERELLQSDLADKTRRIDELSEEKNRLAEKVLRLESALAEASPLSEPPPRPGAKDSNLALVDVLQGEADELRQQIAERDQLIASLQKSDTSGLVKEVGRIRAELLRRNQEVAELRARQGDVEAESQRSKLAALEQEKETLAAKALESAAQLRQANQRITELEQAFAAQPAPKVTVPSGPPAPPRVPLPRADSAPPPPPRSKPARPTMKGTPPARSSQGFPDDPTVKTPRSPGFPDDPTVKTPRMTPPPRTRPPPRTPPRQTPPPTPRTPAQPPPRTPKKGGSIFPPPRGKKDLLD